MADVFVSYAREDIDFVRALHEALQRAERDTWIDWQNIPLTAEWWKEICAGIDTADAFAFVVSPEAIASPVCRRELQHAIDSRKRLIPIMHREGAGEIPAALAAINWVFLRPNDDFERGVSALLSALDTDLDWVRSHTRLLIRAKEWDAKSLNESFLLRGSDLREATQWLAAEARQKQAQPTDLQRAYIDASRRADTWLRRWRGPLRLVAATAVAVALGWLAWIRSDAYQSRTAHTDGARLMLSSDKDLEEAQEHWLRTTALIFPLEETLADLKAITDADRRGTALQTALEVLAAAGRGDEVQSALADRDTVAAIDLSAVLTELDKAGLNDVSLTLGRASSEPFYHAGAVAGAITIALAAGDRARLAPLLSELTNVLPKVSSPDSRFPWCILAARGYLALGEASRVEELAEQAVAAARLASPTVRAQSLITAARGLDECGLHELTLAVRLEAFGLLSQNSAKDFMAWRRLLDLSKDFAATGQSEDARRAALSAWRSAESAVRGSPLEPSALKAVMAQLEVLGLGAEARSARAAVLQAARQQGRNRFQALADAALIFGNSGEAEDTDTAADAAIEALNSIDRRVFVADLQPLAAIVARAGRVDHLLHQAMQTDAGARPATLRAAIAVAVLAGYDDSSIVAVLSKVSSATDLTGIAQGFGDTARINAGTETLDRVPLAERGQARVAFATALAAAGKVQDAVVVLRRAEQPLDGKAALGVCYDAPTPRDPQNMLALADIVEGPCWKVQAMTCAADALAATDRAAARQVAEQALLLCGAAPACEQDVFCAEAATSALTTLDASASVNDLDTAIGHAERIQDPEQRSALRRRAAQLLARRRAYRDARAIAQTCAPVDRLYAYASILRAHALENDPSLASHLPDDGPAG